MVRSSVSNDDATDGGQQIPALNEIRVRTGTDSPEYPDEPEDKQYIILYSEDYEGHGTDVAGNVALLVNEEQAREVKRLAEGAIERIQAQQEDTDAE